MNGRQVDKACVSSGMGDVAFITRADNACGSLYCFDQMDYTLP